MWSLFHLSVLQCATVSIGLTLLLWFVGTEVRLGRVTIGDFVLLQAYALCLALPFSGFGFSASQASVAMANIGDVLELAGRFSSRSGVSAPVKGPLVLGLKNVTFCYGGDVPAVTDLTADIVPGSFVVIAGRNGSGKSTLAQLMAGILEPGEGTIRVSGLNLADIAPEQRHRYILYVPQYIGLFNRTLGENALYPPTSLSAGGIADLLAQWCFYEGAGKVDFMIQVGEQGERLSGGQIQKLELARLMGVRAPVVILDESTSALDPRIEETIIGDLRERIGCRTTLILISHEKRLAEAADEVFFMSAGRLVGRGGHDQLVRDIPGYADLWL